MRMTPESLTSGPLDIDATGHPTVGYGHLCSDKKCSDVSYPIPLSKADGKKLLAKDMRVRHQTSPSTHPGSH